MQCELRVVAHVKRRGPGPWQARTPSGTWVKHAQRALTQARRITIATGRAKRAALVGDNQRNPQTELSADRAPRPPAFAGEWRMASGEWSGSRRSRVLRLSPLAIRHSPFARKEKSRGPRPAAWKSIGRKRPIGRVRRRETPQRRKPKLQCSNLQGGAGVTILGDYVSDCAD